jgi:uncharacterized membrane protein YdjX (TVP38/TMEM64 family)
MVRLLAIGFIAIAGLSSYWLVPWAEIEEFLTPGRLAAFLNGLGPWAPLVLILGMASAVIIPPIPSLPLDLAAGAAYGPFWGTVYVVIGAEIGAIVGFLIARALGRDIVSRVLKTGATFCQKCSDHQLLGLVFFARLIPVFSFDVVSYGSGLTTISLKTFALATLFGMIPPTFAFTYFGSSVASAQWVLIVAGLAMVTLFLVTPKLLLRYRSSSIARLVLGPEPVEPEAQGTIRSGIACAGCRAPVALARP